MKTNELNLRKKTIYSLCAVMTISSIAFTGCSKGNENTKKQDVTIEANNKNNVDSEKNKDNQVEQNINLKDNENSSNKKSAQKDGNENKEMFIKKELKKDSEPEFSTKWKNSQDKKMSACIEGIGPNAEEEGVGKIYIKSLKDDSKWSLELFQEQQKSTPKYIEWSNNNNLIVIIGGAHGTVSQGGNVYKVNVKTGETTEIYNTKDKKIQVITATKKDDKLNLQLLVYEDDDLMNSHKENKTIDIK